MLPAIASAPVVEAPADVLAVYAVHLARTGRGNIAYERAARAFLRRWPQVQGWADVALRARLAAGTSTRPFITFLLVSRRLRPGYDYLLARKLSSFWRDLVGSALQPDLDRFVAAARQLGFSERMASGVASQVVARVLIETGRDLGELTEADLAEFAAACRRRQARTGRGWRHYRGASHAARQVLFHLAVLPNPAPPTPTPLALDVRMAAIPAALRPTFVAYLTRKGATCRPKTISTLATRLAHFGRFLADTDPALRSLAGLDRRQHIEPFLAWLATTTNTVTGEPISVADHARRVHAVANFLAEISEWGWDDAPSRRLLFRTDLPRLPRPLPRYLPVDADRRLTATLADSPNRLAADALLVQRACGLRIGELLDLELDCVHDTAEQGGWLKVPLGKLDTERMVPLDDETLQVLDRVTATRSTCRPLPHPRTGRPAQFLFIHHGKRLSQTAVRRELTRAADAAGLGHVTPHQLRHTYATALVNAGVSLQALMALLGHSSAAMSLRYARLFDTTVRAEYERALDLAKNRLGPLPNTGSTGPDTGPDAPTSNTDWANTPTIKTRLGGGYCLRAPAQGACPYANICEHCPSFHSEPAFLPVLTAQRADVARLADDATSRGWNTETERQRRLLARLDALLAHAAG